MQRLWRAGNSGHLFLTANTGIHRPRGNKGTCDTRKNRPLHNYPPISHEANHWYRIMRRSPRVRMGFTRRRLLPYRVHDGMGYRLSRHSSNTYARGIPQETKALRSKRPETSRQPGTNQRSTGTLQDIGIRSLINGVVLGDDGPRRLLNNAKSSAGELRFRSAIRVEPVRCGFRRSTSTLW